MHHIYIFLQLTKLCFQYFLYCFVFSENASQFFVSFLELLGNSFLTIFVAHVIRNQGSSGIRQLTIHWCTSKMKNTNYPFFRFKLLVEKFEPTNPNSWKVPKIVKPTNKKHVYKTLDTSVIYRPMSPPPLLTIVKIQSASD